MGSERQRSDSDPNARQKARSKPVFWNRCYEPWRIAWDESLKQSLSEQGLAVESFGGSLMWELWHNLKKDGTPYKVFTPYYRMA